MYTQLFSLVLLCFLLSSTLALEGKRLIQFNETDKRWLGVEEVEKLIFSKDVHNFIDVTDFDGLPPFQGTADPIPTAPSHQAYVNSLLPSASSTSITDSIAFLSSYQTRYCQSTTGVQAALEIKAIFELLATGNPDVTVETFSYTTFPQVSVIATIPGTGPHKDEIVVLGAHLDSVGRSSTGDAPGADDDASGVATLLEVFRVLIEAKYTPDYTLQFMGYAGEEIGLVGSRGIANDYAQNSVPVYAVLQLDMTGFASSSGTIGIITDNTSDELNTFLRILVDTYTNLKHVDTACGYGCSDHASWTAAGYRASFPFETPFGQHNPNIHTPNDVLANLDPNQLVEFAYLGIAFAIELAGVA